MKLPNALKIQEAFEALVCDHQDQDTVNVVFRNNTGDDAIKVEIQRPDRDAIQIGPVTDIGGGSYVALVTVQVMITSIDDGQ
jgi:hypothetical protein